MGRQSVSGRGGGQFIQYIAVWYRTVRYSTVWYCAIRYSKVHKGTVRYREREGGREICLLCSDVDKQFKLNSQNQLATNTRKRMLELIIFPTICSLMFDFIYIENIYANIKHLRYR